MPINDAFQLEKNTRYLENSALYGLDEITETSLNELREKGAIVLYQTPIVVLLCSHVK